MNVVTLAAHGDGSWEGLLVASLAASAILVLGYRVYRLSKGGPVADVYGGAVLALLLALMAVAAGADIEWIRWPALVYGVVFGVVVMPVWVLGVLLPLPPGAPDYAFTVAYWLSLVAIVVSTIA